MGASVFRSRLPRAILTALVDRRTSFSSVRPEAGGHRVLAVVTKLLPLSFSRPEAAARPLFNGEVQRCEAGKALGPLKRMTKKMSFDATLSSVDVPIPFVSISYCINETRGLRGETASSE